MIAWTSRSCACLLSTTLGLFAVLVMFSPPLEERAFAKGKKLARIVQIKKCSARVKGGEFSQGDEVVFVGMRKGRRFPVRVRITKEEKKGSYRAKIMEKKKCRFSRGARYSVGATRNTNRDVFVYRQSLDSGYQNLNHKGLNMVLGNGEQNLPSQLVLRSRLQVLPLALSEEGFFGQSVGFFAEVQSSLPVQDEWSFDDGGKIKSQWLAVSGGLLLRPFLIGDAHPTEVVFSYSHTDLSFELDSAGVYQRSVLRPLQCGSLRFDLNQIFGVTHSISVAARAWVEPTVSCQTDEVTQSESLELERQQQSAGVPREKIVSAVELETNPELVDPLSYGGELGMNWELADSFVMGASYGLSFFSGKLQHLSTQRSIELDSSRFLLGIEWRFGR